MPRKKKTPQNLGTVYILHFDVKLAHAGHYVGWAKSLDKRIAHHRNGTGANLTKVIRTKGINFQVARTFENSDKNFERKLKNRRNTPRYCPLCGKGKRQKAA